MLLNRKSNFNQIRKTRQENVVMVVDDDAFQRSLVRMCIGSQATICEVDNGEDVLDAYKEKVPDIVFLDIHMPHKDGIAVLQELLALDMDAFVVMLTADDTRQYKWNTMEQGARGYITKPIKKQDVEEFFSRCVTFVKPPAAKEAGGEG